MNDIKPYALWKKKDGYEPSEIQDERPWLKNDIFCLSS